MLTLEFSERTEDGTRFYYQEKDLKGMTAVKFSDPDNELPYFMIANPTLHQNGLIGVSHDNNLHGRSTNIVLLKEIFDKSPVGILVKMFGNYLIVAKGFIAIKKDHPDNRTFTKSDLDILFAATAQVGKKVTSLDDVKYYMNRKVYDPEYKRLMSMLKPYLAAHRGDILVARSVNAYLLYRFQLPIFTNARSRAEFSDLMKELFYRGIYYSAWKKKEDKRIADELLAERLKELKAKRDAHIIEKTLAVLRSQDPVIVEVHQLDEPVVEIPNISPVIFPELIEEMRNFQPGVVEPELQPATPQESRWRPFGEVSAEATSTDPVLGTVRIQSRQYGNNNLSQQALEEYQETMERMREILNQQLGVDATRLGQTPTEQTVTPVDPPQSTDGQEIFTINLSPEEVQPEMEMPSDSTHVSDEEMARVLSGFSINPNANVRYSTLLHPITGMPIVESTGGEIDPEEVRVFMDTVYRPDAMEQNVDENTEIVIVPDGSDNPTEEELDNDPDAYIDAEYAEEQRDEEDAYNRELGNIS